MNIQVLCEDTVLHPYHSEHGLSLYIQTESHRILFDVGQSDAFAKNAAMLGIDTAEVDIVVLSHGHYDHGNGLTLFLKKNEHAKIYLHEKAFGDYYHDGRYIGLNKQLLAFRDRMVFVSHDTVIDDELTILTAPDTTPPKTALTERIGDHDIPDRFLHELYLEVSDASKKAFFTGCAHKGVLSIANRAYERGATHLVGGFHLNEDTDDAQVHSIAEALDRLPLIYYTGHCTSSKAYQQLESVLCKKIRRLQNGMSFVIGDHTAVARFLFRRGYNCSQSVFGAFADDLGIDFDTAMRLSCSFGGGMGRMREVCGAVSGLLLICGAKNGYSTPETGAVKAAHYKQVQELASLFRKQHGSIICRELLGGAVSSSPNPTARTEEFYRLRPCERLIASAASIAEKELFQK